MSVTVVIAGRLPDSPTYTRRAWAWSAAEPGEYPDARRGTLTIGQRLRCRGAGEEIDLYAVEEEEDTGYPGRSFLLLNETDEEQPDVYRCRVGGPDDSCTCKAGLVGRVVCKHRLALAAVIEQGGLPEAK